MRSDELLAQAAAQRLARQARSSRTPRAWRVSTLRMLARGLRVERQIDFDVARSASTIRPGGVVGEYR